MVRRGSTRANFQQAHDRALAAGDGAAAVRFVRHLSRVTFNVAATSRDWHAKQLASLALPGSSQEDRAYALVRTASVASLIGEASHARNLLDEADALFDQLADEHGSAGAVAVRSEVEFRTGNDDEAVALAERLSAIGPTQTDPVLGSLGERVLGHALLARALEEDDRKAAERSRALLVARAARAAESGMLAMQAGMLGNLALSLFALKDYSESVATAQYALAKHLEMESTLRIETPMMADSISAVGMSVCDAGDFRLGITPSASPAASGAITLSAKRPSPRPFSHA